MSKLPTDANGNPIQALSFNGTLAHQIAVTGTTKNNETNFNDATGTLYLTPTVNMHVVFGGEDVTATTDGHFMQANVPLPLSKNNAKRIAAIKADGEEDGTLHISEMI